MTMSNIKLSLLIKNVPKTVSELRLATVLGFCRDDLVREKKLENDLALVKEVKVILFDGSLGNAMSIIAKHNFRVVDGFVIRIELQPISKYNDMQTIDIEVAGQVAPKDIFSHFTRWGFVAGVRQEVAVHPGTFLYHVYFTMKHAATEARAGLLTRKSDRRETCYIGEHELKFLAIRNVATHIQDFWVPPVTRGNVIAVPTNVATHASASVSHAVTYKESSTIVPNASKRRHSVRESQRSDETPPLLSMHNHINRKGSHSPLVPQPGGTRARTDVRGVDANKDLSAWYKAAFVIYETLYNISDSTEEGRASISSMTWGSQLDISTIRIHYGSTYTATNATESIPLVSSATVQMRQYGDKDSASEVLDIYRDGKLADHSMAMTEGQNLLACDKVVAMRCLESGHLVTSAFNEYLKVWDIKENTPQPDGPTRELWIDAKGMDVCAVDRIGRIAQWDVTTAVVKSAFVLVSSDIHAQVARWDMRTSKPVQFTPPYMGKMSTSMQFVDCEWSPHSPQEFMTASTAGVRIWDARKMNTEVYYFSEDPVKVMRARWSPHKPGVVAVLGQDGLLKIHNLKPSSQNEQSPKLDPIFIHRGHRVPVSDFSWCPFVEDTICTVAPGFGDTRGGIQVWRPRNLHNLDDNDEP
ncbi:Histone-binding protein rbbp4 [Podila epigama]|nr:Histone-binding protein rbbp4 [Podila epigama]